MKRITVKQLYEICQRHKYIVIRLSCMKVMAINCRVAKIALKGNHFHADHDNTDYVSFRPCNINEYISLKNGFIKNK